MKALKITAIVSIVLMFALSGKAQDEMESPKVPDPVKKAFKTEKPKMNDVEWEKEGNYFAVEFKEEGVEKEMVYDAKGNVVSTETGIDTGSLMPSIKKYLEENYRDYEIEEAEKIEKKGKTSFEVEVEANDEEIELLFDSNGQFIKEESEKEEDENDEEKEDE
ncbi:MAG: PepSY-like domain-containing protein [Bacteroidales bacterium]|nr:PepSY-like domain-containing protein [Bacteroidales bacterium]MCF8336682.1 PepSY-like domain-containing protein [Bacteroidales bacterium]